MDDVFSLPPDQPLLRVADSFRLPGLGLLARAAALTPLLDPLPLHTALAVRLRLPTGEVVSSLATVEEVAADSFLQRALLLTSEDLPEPLPAGTVIYAQAVSD